MRLCPAAGGFADKSFVQIGVSRTVSVFIRVAPESEVKSVKGMPGREDQVGNSKCLSVWGISVGQRPVCARSLNRIGQSTSQFVRYQVEIQEKRSVS